MIQRNRIRGRTHSTTLSAIALVPLIALVGFAAPAACQFKNLSWDDCGISGSYNRQFACNTNEGSEVLIASFDPPLGVTKLTGIRAVISVTFASATTVPAWWGFYSGGCREGSISVDAAFQASGASQCLDYWFGKATSDMSWSTQNNKATIIVNCEIPESEAGPVTLGNEYFAFRLIIDHTRTVGEGSCTGCTVGACFILEGIRLYQASGFGDRVLCNPRDRDWVVWQNGTGVPGGCPGESGWPMPPCTVSGAHPKTWGAAKTIYR